jgi:hypothetical protein
VSFYPFKFTNLKPNQLKRYLDNSGIKWKVLVVSACYSGGFVDELTNDFTLVATAASADDKSFGCGDNSHFTYYGEVARP